MQSKTREDYLKEFLKQNHFEIDWNFNEITHVVLEDKNTEDCFILSTMDGLEKTISEAAKILRFMGWLMMIKDE